MRSVFNVYCANVDKNFSRFRMIRTTGFKESNPILTEPLILLLLVRLVIKVILIKHILFCFNLNFCKVGVYVYCADVFKNSSSFRIIRTTGFKESNPILTEPIILLLHS